MRIFLAVFLLINAMFAYENITIKDGNCEIYVAKNAQIYINFYDKTDKFYGHVFFDRDKFIFSDINSNNKSAKFIAKSKKSGENLSVDLNLSKEKPSATFNLKDEKIEIKLTLSAKYPLISMFARSEIPKHQVFEFSKSLVCINLEKTLLKSKKSCFLFSNLLKTQYNNELNAFMNTDGNDLMGYANESFQNIFFAGKNIFVTKQGNYLYDGGAHANQSDIYENFLNGKKLTLKDILTDTKNPKLLHLIWEEIKSSAYIKKKDLKISENFAFSPFGIVFIYNPYEIAPYSHGIFEVFFSYDEIWKFLNNSIKPHIKPLILAN